jgi:hypothetical protein
VAEVTRVVDDLPETPIYEISLIRIIKAAAVPAKDRA